VRFLIELYRAIVGLRTGLKERQVPEKEAQEFCDQQGLHFVETSAATGANVKEAFEAAVRAVIEAVESGALAVDGDEDS